MTVTASWEPDREHEDRLADAVHWTRGRSGDIITWPGLSFRPGRQTALTGRMSMTDDLSQLLATLLQPLREQWYPAVAEAAPIA